MYEDKTLVCKECGQEFVFTAGEQEFYAERGFQNEPQRCKACRDARPGSTSPLSALLAAVRPECPLSPRAIVLCTAAIALPRCASRADRLHERAGRPLGALLFFAPVPQARGKLAIK